MSDFIELLNRKEIDGFTVEISALAEDSHPDDSFEWENDNHRKETIDWMVNHGVTGWFCARVTISKHGIELASDYLGGCSYPDKESFLNDDYCSGMIDRAMSEAKTTIKKLCEG